MAKVIIKLEKEDIKTSVMGENIMIDAGQFNLIFSPEALTEFFADIRKIRNGENEIKQLNEPPKLLK